MFWLYCQTHWPVLCLYVMHVNLTQNVANLMRLQGTADKLMWSLNVIFVSVMMGKLPVSRHDNASMFFRFLSLFCLTIWSRHPQFWVAVVAIGFHMIHFNSSKWQSPSKNVNLNSSCYRQDWDVHRIFSTTTIKTYLWNLFIIHAVAICTVCGKVFNNHPNISFKCKEVEKGVHYFAVILQCF